LLALLTATVSRAEQLLGRALPLLEKYAPTGRSSARLTLVTLGSVTPIARLVVDALRRSKRFVRLLGVEWLRPFPDAALAAAIEDTDRVVVVERACPELPLLSRVQRALSGRPVRVGSASYGPERSLPRPRDLFELVDRSIDAELPKAARLGPPPAPRPSRHPARQVALERLARGGPASVSSVSRPAGLPREDIAVTVLSRGGAPPERLLQHWQRLAPEVSRATLSWLEASDRWRSRLAFGSSAARTAADDEADAVVLADPELLGGGGGLR